MIWLIFGCVSILHAYTWLYFQRYFSDRSEWLECPIYLFRLDERWMRNGKFGKEKFCKELTHSSCVTLDVMCRIS